MGSVLHAPAYLTPVAEALSPSVLRALRRDVRALRQAALEYERMWSDELAAVDPAHRCSARNLLHYLSLRHYDARAVQAALAEVGLSSLGRAESHVLVTLDRVDGLLSLALGEPLHERGDEQTPVGFREGRFLLKQNTVALLGQGRRSRPSRIMVTLPTEAANDATFVEQLVAAGMDCARINFAHDDEGQWAAMVANVRKAERARDRDVRVVMDLPGPKIRTGRVAGKRAPRVQVGDHVYLCDHLEDPRPAWAAGAEAVVEGPASVLATQVGKGDPVLFDDAKLEMQVLGCSEVGILLEVTKAKAKGSKLKPEKGINLPGRTVRVPALTPSDRELLRFASEHADAVSMSFVRTPGDVDALLEALSETGRQDLGIILKIETVEGFECLPRLLLRSMRNRTVGVMIARGDLAAEVGFERLAEVQEEILWIAEAAHAPTVWATQVLEQQAKCGTPSRAEVTDAAMGVRAESVMLNKGPHIVETVRTLDGILRRMQQHQRKKGTLLRPLRVSHQEAEALRLGQAQARPLAVAVELSARPRMPRTGPTA